MINSDVKEKWIAALTGNDFKQGRRALRPTSDTFCCLGVLCEVYRQETGDGEWRHAHDVKEFSQGFVAIDLSPCFSTTPGIVARWANLSFDEEDRLAEMNDAGTDFTDIATYISEKL